MHLCPLLFHGLFFLIGISCSLFYQPIYLLLIALLFLIERVRIFTRLVTLVLGFFWASYAVTLPKLPKEGAEGFGIFKPISVHLSQSPFGSSFITKGVLTTFTTHSEVFHQIPCLIYTPLNKVRPSADHLWIVQGRLLAKTFPNYVFKPTSCTPDFDTYCITEIRFRAKKWLGEQLIDLFPTKESCSFLTSMITGEIDDRLMALQFNRLGLLHLLGVSGFQFSLLASLLTMILNRLFARKKSVFILISILSIYAFILGSSPPIQRAYIMSVIYAIGVSRGWQSNSLNSLGAALLWQLILNPLALFELGFQFTFLCTAAILLIYPLFRKVLSYLFEKRSFSDILQLNLVDRAGHFMVSLIKEACALNLAIHLATFPLVIYHFHKLPLLSLFYNLFLPPLVSVAYLFLLPALVLTPLSKALGFVFVKIADYLTQAALFITHHPPILLDFQLRFSEPSLEWTIIIITLCLALFYKSRPRFDRIRGR